MMDITMDSSKPTITGAERPVSRTGIASFGGALGAFLMALAMTQCGAEARAQAPSAASEQRIVAGGGAITEILYALGLQDRIVGVDTTSQFPAAALKDKPSVGYVRALSAEGVLSLKPSLVITIPNAGPPDTLKLISEAGVRIVQTNEDHSAGGVIARVRDVGRLTSTEAEAGAIAATIERQFTNLARARATLDKPRRVLFILALQNGRPMVGGRNSAADAIITLAGGVNAATAIEGYKPMTDEAVIAAAPDVILMMNRGNHAASASDVFALPAFSATPAAAAKALIVMDGLYLLGFGPRTADAARDLMTAIYPEKAAQLSLTAK
jgi:iron complex transport system substrate-binding protein